MLNEGQREIYEYIINGFVDAPQRQRNTIIMGTAGVGKSYLIRTLENGIWQAAKNTFGEEQYPSIRSVVKLAAYTGLNLLFFYY